MHFPETKMQYFDKNNFSQFVQNSVIHNNMALI